MAILTLIVSNRYMRVGVERRTILYYIGVSCLVFPFLAQINTGVLRVNLILEITTGMFLVGLGILFRENEIRDNLKNIQPLRIR